MLPEIRADSRIALDVSLQIVEFAGFEDPKPVVQEPVISRILTHADGTRTESATDAEKDELRESKFDAQGVLLSTKTVPLSKDMEVKSKHPMISTRHFKSDVVMPFGQTLVLEMDPRTDTQNVEEEDASGNIINSQTVLHKRRTLVFITAYLTQ
ncbi:hypothetical protein [Prosthecobacter fusiformis]|uniref:hypothetical protein n=1 Tax=Prosthecobacter fusiformis TaxID=48464 RepID=UPI0010618155|nr:hypothetical protein [Prosthecobacter fusiformis]